MELVYHDLPYTLESPTLSWIFSITPETPIRSMSLAVTVSNPHRISLRMSPFRLINGALIPAWIEELRINPSSCARWRNVPANGLGLAPLRIEKIGRRTMVNTAGFG